MAPPVKHYREYHKVIKAIEKCSLQALFGPEVISTGQLLQKKSSVPLVGTLKASHNNDINTVKKRVRFNLIPFFSAKFHGNWSDLPLDAIIEDDIISPRFSSDDAGKAINSISQDGNIPSNWSINGDNMPSISTFEAVASPFQESNFLGRVPQDVWAQKVEDLRKWTKTETMYRDTYDLSYSNHKHPNHDRVWDSKNLFCIGCTKDTMKRCTSCGRNCCFWSTCKEMANSRKAWTLPHQRVKATQWLRKIAGLMSYGIDEPTFMACSRCGKVLCPKCTSICEICDALCCPDCCGRCPICKVPKCVRCKPNRKDKCSYHNGPPAI